MVEQPFWQRIPLFDMNVEQWEQVCDGCGKCCLHKLEDEDTEEIYYTDIACKLLGANARCSNYANRRMFVSDCINLRQVTLEQQALPRWLPSSCSYRRLAEGRGLADWHPLVCGDPDAIHRAGQSVVGRVRAETEVADDDYQEHIVWWVDADDTRR